jgi:photosystem II stability/assembly factor-like uncharacterized protein
MKELIKRTVAGVLLAAAAYALPGELVVVSDKEVRPDEAAGFYYLGSCAAGYLYTGSSAAVGRAAPFRVLDRDAQAKDYYIVWAPEWVGLTPQAFEHLGAAARLSEYEILVGLEGGLGPGALRAVDHRIELIKLGPVTPVDWRYDGEAPPAKKDPRIEGAIDTITEAEYAGYIRQLQNFRTRWTETDGCDAARDYIRNFFALQNLEASFFPFDCTEIKDAHFADGKGVIYVDTDAYVFKRTRDGGTSWDSFYGSGTSGLDNSFWVNERIGFIWRDRVRNAISRTRDGGYTWKTYKITPSEPGAEFTINDLFFTSANVAWLGGRKSVPPRRGELILLKTTDGAKTWASQYVADGFAARVIRAYDEDHLWVTDLVGVYYSSDGGNNWRLCSIPTFPVLDIAPVSATEAWATVGTSRLIHTPDGTNWRFEDPGFKGEFAELEFPDRMHGFAAGDRLIATSDGGKTWRLLRKPGEAYCDILSLADGVHGVIGSAVAQELYVTADGGKSFRDLVRGMDLASENVVGERLGSGAPDEIVIIGGHFDSASDQAPSLCPGAEDNASGTACAMAAARAFRNMSFKKTVRYVAFGAEEQGTIGSKAYANYCAQKGEKIVAVLNADMVCYDEENGARDDYSIADYDYNWLYDYLKAVGGLYGNRLIYDSIGQRPGSDHGSFWNVGYPAIGASGGAVDTGGGSEYHWYHTTEDTLDKLHPELGVRFVRDYAATLAHLAGVGDYLFEPEPPGYGAAPFARPFAVYPNPYCYATCAGGVSFVGIKSPAKVEIYDLAGRRVARKEVAAGRDACVWSPATAEGETLAPGVYLYRVDGQEQKKGAATRACGRRRRRKVKRWRPAYTYTVSTGRSRKKRERS